MKYLITQDGEVVIWTGFSSHKAMADRMGGGVTMAGTIRWFEGISTPYVRGGSITLGIEPYDPVSDRKIIERHLFLD